MILSFRGHLTCILIIVALSTLFLRNILFSEALPAGWDISSVLRPLMFLSSNGRYFELWEETSIGYVTPLTILNVFAFLAHILNNPNIVLKLLYFTVNTGIGLSFYFFIFQITRNKKTSLIASFIYAYNPWIVSKWASGDIRYPFMYFIAPLVFYLLQNLLHNIENANNKALMKLCLCISVVLSILIGLRFDPFMLILPFVLLYVTIYFFFCFKTKWTFPFVNLFYAVAFCFVFILLFNLYVFLPLILIKTPFFQVHFNFQELYQTSLPILHVFQGKGLIYSYLFWDGKFTWYTHPFLPPLLYQLILVIIPLIALLSLIVGRNSKTVLSFFILLTVGIFLSKGPHPPLSSFYEFAYQKIFIVRQLHSPNRFGFMIWFAYSFLIGYVLNYLDSKNKKQLRHLYIITLFVIMIAVLLSGAIYIFEEGYLAFNDPKSEVEPHIFIANDKSEFRVLTVPFGYSRMFMEGGWLQYDIGRNGGIYSKKPVFRNVRFESRYRDLFEFLEFHTFENKTGRIPKIIGIYDVKYIIEQGYPITQPHHEKLIFEKYHRSFWLTYKQHEILENTVGIKKVKTFQNEEYVLKVGYAWERGLEFRKELPPKLVHVNVTRPSVLFQNLYWIPRIFSPENQLIIVGGLNSFLKFAEIDSFNFSNWNLLFADHVIENLGKNELIQQIKKSDYVAFVNSAPLDLAMLLANATWVKVKNSEKNSAGWEEDDWPIIEGFFAYNRDVVAAKEKRAKAIYKVETSNDSNYEIWIRVFLHNKAGKLKIFVDGEVIGEIEPHATRKLGFKWIKLGEIKLKEGKHKIEVVNENGENKLNGIIIAKKGEVEVALNYVKKLTDKKSVYLVDVEKCDKIEDVGKKVILYRNDKPIGNADIKAEQTNNVKYLELKKIRPSKWIVKVNSTAPYTLVFSNSYHPMWRAFVNGKEYKSIPSYYFINSFQINETGKHEVIIEFIGQRIQNISLIISGLAYLGCFSYLFYDWRKRRREVNDR